jgi:hypothetical protein
VEKFFFQTFFRISIKHWQNVKFNDLSCKFRSDLFYRNLSRFLNDNGIGFKWLLDRRTKFIKLVINKISSLRNFDTLIFFFNNTIGTIFIILFIVINCCVSLRAVWGPYFRVIRCCWGVLLRWHNSSACKRFFILASCRTFNQIV